MTNKVRDLKQLQKYIAKTRSTILRAHAESVLKVVTRAEAFAKRNATKEFIGRNGRKLSGRLLNSIFSGFDTINKTQSMPKGFIGTRGIPYGRIHELGGTIVPKKAKYLWIKQHGGKADRFRRLTPSEFVSRMQKKDRRFKILGKKNGKGKVAIFQALRKKDYTVLFALAKRVDMPARPYLKPAVEEAVNKYGFHAKKTIRQLLRKIKL
jgi:hypothetical protein